MRVLVHTLVTASIVIGALASTGCSEAATSSEDGGGNGGLGTQTYKVSITPKSETMRVGDARQYSASVTDASGLPVQRAVETA